MSSEELPNPSEPQCTTATADKVSVAKDYMSKYYDRVVNDERSFVREHSKVRAKKTTVQDYHLLNLIGRGAFGEVRLGYRNDDPSQTIFAIKICRKDVMISRNHIHHVRSERELMVETKKQHSQGNFNQWAVELYQTFQDDDYLYFVMEFCGGGDMMGWLIKLNIFSEDVARFYVAELVLAIKALHRLGYAHRDLKPDNILIDKTGHIKLTDFGLCKAIPQIITPDEPEAVVATQTTTTTSTDTKRKNWQEIRKNKALFYTTVGSPGYIAPEVIKKTGYGVECDWWGVGVILYEMLCGYPPFYGDDSKQTAHKIVRWREYLEFPRGQDAISREATDLIVGLLTDAKFRMGFDQIILHPFFAGINWANIQNQQAPFQITLSSSTDTKYFDAVAELAPRPNQDQNANAHDKKFLFFGFTSKFDEVAQSTANTNRKKAAPPIPDFADEESEDD